MASRAPDDDDDLAHFAIDSPRADADYDSSITTADEDGHLLPCSPGTLENGPTSPTSPPGLTTADHFALAARTSDIVSSYRDYLTEMEGVSAKNARTASEMEAIRGDLGAPNSGLPRVKESNVAFFEEAPRPPRFLRGAPQDRRTKRRLLMAGVGVAILAVAGLAVYAANESEARSQQSPQLWDKEAADILEKEAEEMMRQHSAKPPKARAPAEVQSEKGAATKMIEEILADSKAKVTGRGGKKSAKTGKEGTESKSGKGESPGDMSVSSSKSAKAFSGGDAASSKSGKAMSIASGKSEKEEGVFSISGSASSKAGKSSSDESATSTPPPPPVDEDESPTLEEVAPTPKPPVVSGKDTRSSALHLEEASLLYEAIGEQYGPEFFDRGSGWTGSSYAEAVAFCNDTYVHVEGSGGSGVPCSYEVYCPEGPDSIPFGGYRSGTAYAPFVSTEHWIGWVQLSEGHPCVTYSQLEPVPTTEETQTIMCCKSV